MLTIKLNHSKRTYTIRRFDKNGKLIAKYRSNPQGREISENWTERYIEAFLRYSGDYYLVK